MLYVLNLKDPPASFLNRYIFSLYQGLNRGPSDPEADDIPMRHFACLITFVSVDIGSIFIFHSLSKTNYKAN